LVQAELLQQMLRQMVPILCLGQLLPQEAVAAAVIRKVARQLAAQVAADQGVLILQVRQERQGKVMRAATVFWRPQARTPTVQAAVAVRQPLARLQPYLVVALQAQAVTAQHHLLLDHL
jgi:hypothetical protein